MKSTTVNNGMTEKSATAKLTSQDVSKITAKVSTLWCFVSDYLEMLCNTGAMMDEEFTLLFKQLMDYVYGKINIPQANNILAEYVVYELQL